MHLFYSVLSAMEALIWLPGPRILGIFLRTHLGDISSGLKSHTLIREAAPNTLHIWPPGSRFFGNHFPQALVPHTLICEAVSNPLYIWPLGLCSIGSYFPHA